MTPGRAGNRADLLVGGLRGRDGERGGQQEDGDEARAYGLAG